MVAIEFVCYVCGNESEVVCAPDPPEHAICPDCCGARIDGHEYKYDRYEQTHVCDRCGQFAPLDWIADYYSE
jgi:hypothetical protein